MQTGYRLDQAAEAKALKAALFNRKMDNVSYGSDIKLQPPTLPTVASIGVPTPITQAVPTASPTPTTQAITTATPTLAPAPAPVSIHKSTIAPSSPLHDEIMKTISPGVSPSKIKHATQTTTVATQPAPPPTIITTGDQETKPPISSVAASEAPTESTSFASTTVGTPASEITLTKPAKQSQKNKSNDTLQKQAKKLLDDYNQARIQTDPTKKPSDSVIISLFDLKGIQDPNFRLTVKPNQSNFSFIRKATRNFTEGNTLYTKDSSGGVIEDQTRYNVIGSVDEAIRRIKQGKGVFNPTPKVGETNGLGLSELSPNVHWAQRVDKADKNFVMYPTWVRGNIRLYTTGKHRAAVSHNKASKAFLNMVADIVNRGTFEQADYAALEPGETQAANTFIKVAMPIVPSGVRFSVGNVSDINALRKRYKVLVSELAAGNQGQMIREEMAGILRSLQRLKAMPKSKVDQLISGLNDL